MVVPRADGGVVVDFHPQARKIIHFPLEDFPGQAILRDAVAQPAAGLGAAASKITAW